MGPIMTGVLAVPSACVVLAVVLWLRARRHERTVLLAATGMSAQLPAGAVPQRVLLGEVAEVLVAQDEAAVRLAARVRELPPGRAAEIAGLFAEFNTVDEPTEPLAEFLGRHAGRADRVAVSAFTTDVVRRATRRLPSGNGPSADELRDFTAQGSATLVAEAIVAQGLARLSPDPGPDPGSRYPVPRLGGHDLGSAALGLEKLARRQLRLATLIHDQAETVLRSRARRRVLLDRAAQTEPLRALLQVLRTPAPAIDLPSLQVALDAVGEALDIVADLLAADQDAQAVRLLAGLNLPVPEGFPGRIFHRELLAQARPLTELGVRHRLAVAHWTVENFHTRLRPARGRLP